MFFSPHSPSGPRASFSDSPSGVSEYSTRGGISWKTSRVMRRSAVRADLLVPMQRLVEEGVAAGHGDEDISALAQLLAEPAHAKG
jgi:hypothetical protein